MEETNRLVETSSVERKKEMAIRVLIVDDHCVVREGLRMFLAGDPELEVVGEATDGAEAIQQAKLLRPNVVVMDLLMSPVDGITATRAIRNDLPDTEVLALTSVLGGASVVEAIKAGAIGYLLKHTRATELRSAIKAAAAGQAPLSPEASVHLLGAVRTPDLIELLSPREIDVLRFLVQGISNKEIARALHVAEETIKSHVRHILAKLGAQSRTQAVLMAIKLGIVSPEL
jgi:DNA-binding NarL/FixJ family response regulator